MESHGINSIIPGRSPPLHYYTLTLITMYGHQNKSRLVVVQYFWTRLRVPDYGTVMFLREIKLEIGSGVTVVISKEIYRS